MKSKERIAIIGGGPGGLFLFKQLVASGSTDLIIDIYEKMKLLGAGMPYSREGASEEHITNVSGNEIPDIVTPVMTWIKTLPKQTLQHFNIDLDHFSEYRVLPRLLFGQYLSDQFSLLMQMADEKGIAYHVHTDSMITDIIDRPGNDRVQVEVNGKTLTDHHKVIICTGHNWPVKHEGRVPNYFDSPYPPAKLNLKLDHAVAIRGSSLTAVDAIRTLALNNGTYKSDKNGKLIYNVAKGSEGFKIVMHTRNGMLPAVRFHLEDSHLRNNKLLSKEQIAEHIKNNNGFLSLDHIFEKDFKEIFRDKRPEFYQHIKHMTVEEFVAAMMELREDVDPFKLLMAEYAEAENSIERHESIYWKEMLGVLSFALNYPAKHLSAEDMLRLQNTLIPLISIVIAYIPQSSALQLLALHKAGVLDMIAVGDDSHVEAEPKGGATYYYTDEHGKAISQYYQTYVDCVGQPHLSYEEFIFKSMLHKHTVSPARLKFRSAAEAKKIVKHNHQVQQDADGGYYLKVPGIAINDSFQVLNDRGAPNPRIYIMAVPYIGGYNPDYSGLDFCEEASSTIAKTLFKVHEPTATVRGKTFSRVTGRIATGKKY